MGDRNPSVVGRLLLGEPWPACREVGRIRCSKFVVPEAGVHSTHLRVQESSIRAALEAGDIKHVQVPPQRESLRRSRPLSVGPRV